MTFKKEINIDDGKIDCKKDISHLNTLGLQSLVAAYTEFYHLDQLPDIFNFSKKYKLPIIPLGEGSNLVLAKRLNALVLHTKIKGIEILSEQEKHIDIRVAAGENWHEFVANSIKNQWYGLENLGLIPGCVGAAPIQNIGAYGVEVAESILAVHTLILPNTNHTTLENTDAEYKLDKRIFKNQECEFSYRDSIFKKRLCDKLLITHVDFRLAKSFTANISYPSLRGKLSLTQNASTLTAKNVFDAVCAIRQSKLPDPKDLPNAGSFFKNIELDEESFISFKKAYPDAPYFAQEYDLNNQVCSYKIPSAWLIEQCGFKGCREGNLGMHSKQALVLVNYNNTVSAQASGEDVQRFAQQIQTAVMEKFDLALETEPRFYL